MSSLGWGLKLAGTSSVLSAIAELQVDGSAEWQVAAGVHYAPYVEFGTSRMAAQPYLRPAVEKAESDLARLIASADDVDTAVKLVALKVEREAKRRAPVDTGALKNSITAHKK